MCKDNQHYETSKIAVDFYHPQSNGDFICSCFTPGASSEMEPEYLVKTVSFEELKDLIADGTGKVYVSHDSENGEHVPFAKYLSTCDDSEIQRFCARVINAREFRTHFYGDQPENREKEANLAFYVNARKRVQNGDFSFEAIANMVYQHNRVLGYIK